MKSILSTIEVHWPMLYTVKCTVSVSESTARKSRLFLSRKKAILEPKINNIINSNETVFVSVIRIICPSALGDL